MTAVWAVLLPFVEGSTEGTKQERGISGQRKVATGGRIDVNAKRYVVLPTAFAGNAPRANPVVARVLPRSVVRFDAPDVKGTATF